MSKISLPVCVRFKADLSIEEFSAALSSAIGGNLSGLVGAFSPACPYFENEKARREVELLSAGIVSRVKRAEAKSIEAALRSAAPAEPIAESARTIELTRRPPNPRGRKFDPTIYKLKNDDGRTVSGRQVDLRASLNMSPLKLWRLLTIPGRTTHDGWYRPTTRTKRGAQGE